jgi:hypothetical protein
MTRDVFRSGGAAAEDEFADEGEQSASFDGLHDDESGLHDPGLQEASFPANDMTQDHGAAKETFAEGEHPLEGVPLLAADGTVNDLPAPEPLSNGADRTQASQLGSIIGDYRVRCFLSSNWQLRDAVLTKTSMLIEGLIEDPGWEKAAPALCGMIARAVDDRNPKVFLTSLIVLDDVLHEMEKASMAAKSTVPLLENIILTLIGKLSDRAQPKAVEGAFSMLVNFALSSAVGHTCVITHDFTPAPFPPLASTNSSLAGTWAARRSRLSTARRSGPARPCARGSSYSRSS